MEYVKPRLARLATILTQLQSKRLVTARELSERHGVGIRTIYRDIRTLEQSGVPIVTEEGRGYSLVEGYKLPPVTFTEEEANALITAQQMLGNTEQSLADAYSSAITKIRATLRYTDKDKAELLSQRIHVRTKPKKPNTGGQLIALQSAITNYQLCELSYKAYDGTPSQRSVEPFAMYNTTDNWILLAWCRLRKEFRAFRLDRMQEITISETRFEPHDYTLQQYFEDCAKKLSDTPDIGLTQWANSFASTSTTQIMQNTQLDTFHVIGITVRTVNGHENTVSDIVGLWTRFMEEGIAGKIPNRTDESAMAVYMDYEGDYTQPYTMLVGCKVASLDEIPDGLVGHTVQGGNFAPFVAKGDLTKGAVVRTWNEIWSTDLNRAYTSDIEVYGPKSQNLTDAEVDIFVALN